MTILPKKAFPTLYVQKCAFERYGSRAWFTRHPTMRHIHISVQASSIDNTSKNSIYYSTSHSRALLFIFRFFLYDFIRVFFGVCLIVFMLVDTLTRLLQKKMLFFFCFPILNWKLFRSQNLSSMLLRFFQLFYSLRHFSASNISNLCLLCWWYRGSSSIRIAKKKLYCICKRWRIDWNWISIASHKIECDVFLFRLFFFYISLVIIVVFGFFGCGYSFIVDSVHCKCA